MVNSFHNKQYEGPDTCYHKKPRSLECRLDGLAIHAIEGWDWVRLLNDAVHPVKWPLPELRGRYPKTFVSARCKILDYRS